MNEKNYLRCQTNGNDVYNHIIIKIKILIRNEGIDMGLSVGTRLPRTKMTVFTGFGKPAKIRVDDIFLQEMTYLET
jgi:hypothetical protein